MKNPPEKHLGDNIYVHFDNEHESFVINKKHEKGHITSTIWMSPEIVKNFGEYIDELIAVVEMEEK